MGEGNKKVSWCSNNLTSVETRQNLYHQINAKNIESISEWDLIVYY